MNRSTALAVTLLAVLGYGIYELFAIRMDAGDLYPAYSSFRPSPDGCLALYEGLRRTGLPVERFLDEGRLLRRPEAAALFLGIRQPPDLAALPQAGRLIYGFRPRQSGVPPVAMRPGVPGQKAGIVMQWEQRRAPESEDGLDADRLWWRVVFRVIDPEWRILSGTPQRALAVERRYGPTTVVLVSDADWFTNRELARARQTALLLRILGQERPILFVESHLGIQQRPGVVELARKFGLGGFLLSLLLLAALVIWQRSVSFLPPFPEEASPGSPLAGADAAAGFANLLRRTVPAARITTLCMEQWRHAAAGMEDMARRRPEVEAAWAAIQATGRPDPVRDYNRLCRAAKKEKP